VGFGFGRDAAGCGRGGAVRTVIGRGAAVRAGAAGAAGTAAGRSGGAVRTGAGTPAGRTTSGRAVDRTTSGRAVGRTISGFVAGRFVSVTAGRTGAAAGAPAGRANDGCATSFCPAALSAAVIGTNPAGLWVDESGSAAAVTAGFPPLTRASKLRSCAAT
jgi:hypothetical protein